jgi:hypothetical protein
MEEKSEVKIPYIDIKVTSIIGLLLLKKGEGGEQDCADVIYKIINTMDRKQLKDIIHVYFYGQNWREDQILSFDFPEEYKILSKLFGITID